MNKKVILILVDGMRPDAISLCGNEFVNKFVSEHVYYNDAKTVMPSITLPTQISLFQSVPPECHGITTNTFIQSAKPINGLCDVLKKNDKRSAFFYSWEPLRDLSRPGALDRALFYKYTVKDFMLTDALLIQEAVSYIKQREPDFLFLHLDYTDSSGHSFGYMSDTYLQTVYKVWDCIKTMYEEFSEQYTFIVTADHGGHDHTHGIDSPEDMTIPIVIGIAPETKVKGEATIMDIAPTITKIMGVNPDADWRGTSLIL
ncbi:MAG: alkaline phosphatase family protein [Treponema sp.]|jgi:predicted AlkP superfamily pyrophosphatase or phosphodiesterase|nr:alkaline phosphatase family protein [Treponema sp.]